MAVINIRGVLVDLIFDIDPEFYGTFATIEKKGKKVIMVQFNIYGTMLDSLIYYNFFKRH